LITTVPAWTSWKPCRRGLRLAEWSRVDLVDQREQRSDRADQDATALHEDMRERAGADEEHPPSKPLALGEGRAVGHMTNRNATTLWRGLAKLLPAR